MSTSVGYQLLEQSPDSAGPSSDQIRIFNRDNPNMGKALGTFRAVYVVALCSIGSFLFAYVSGEKASPICSQRC